MYEGLKRQITSIDNQYGRFVGTTLHITLAGWSKRIRSVEYFEVSHDHPYSSLDVSKSKRVI
jgi:hypothetical protein